jgi:hypothetical protein
MYIRFGFVRKLAVRYLCWYLTGKEALQARVA